jgi:HEAT repeat protein
MSFFSSVFSPNIDKLEQAKDLTKLIKCLGSKDIKLREKAQEALARMGEPAVDLLIEALAENDENVHTCASRAMQLMNDLAVPKLIIALKDGNEQIRENAAITLAHIHSAVAVEPLIQAWDENRINSYVARACLETLTGLKDSKVKEGWRKWWNVNSKTWRYSGLQADHYIIRMHPPKPADQRSAIIEILQVNGYIRGTATVDFEVTPSIDNAYITGLALKYAENANVILHDKKTKIHDFSGKAKGKVVVVFIDETKTSLLRRQKIGLY